MVELSDICPKCQGQLILSYGTKSCLQCGKQVMSDKERRAWWREHKPEIAQDYMALGATKTIVKWSIPGHTLSRLTRKPQAKSLKPSPAVEKQLFSNGLPPFPPWRDDWLPEVQMQWLEVYSELTTSKEKRVT